jgi:hemoglobin/transferrin/lactoferrin receptor protein
MRRDFEGFTVDQLGVSLQLESPTRFGRFVYGFDWYHDEVDTFHDNYLAGVFTGSNVQGPLGDDGRYDLFGAYVEDSIPIGCLELVPGIRFTYARAEADRVDNPEVAGSDPTTPGNVISVSNDWTNVVGSLKGLYHLHPWWNVYASASQAFRAPSLHDLTSLDTTSVVETPAPDLDAEKYVSFELGVKHESPCTRLGAAVWYTILDDTIVRSPTGTVIDMTPEVRKDNTGDGYVWGIEFEGAWAVNTCFTVFGNLSWMDGEVDQLDPNDVLTRRPLDRMKPLTTLLGVRYEPTWSRFWAEVSWLHSEREDRLSYRDEADNRRIPPDGTPGYDVLFLRSGYRISDCAEVSFSIENLTDRYYRVHGSGQNEPGLNAVLSFGVRF